MRRAALFFASALGLACAPVVDLSLPALADRQSCILGVERGESVRVEALDLHESRALALPPDAELTAAFYPKSLAELGLAPGEIARVPGGRRSIPPFTAGSLWTRAVAGEWRPLAELDHALASFRFDGPSVADCLDDVGCADAMPLGVCPASCVTPPAPASPAAPALPDFAPCPAGWTVRPAASPRDVATCTPPIVAARVDCPDGQLQTLDGGACTPAGAVCPAGEWPERLPAGSRILYVSVSGADGDGTVTHPFGTIAEATAIASPGTIIALGRGEFAEAVVLPAGVHVWGACAGETRITGAPGSDGAVLEVLGPGVVIQDLSVAGAGVGLSITGADRDARVVGVAFVSGGFAVAVDGGGLSAERVLVRGRRDGLVLMNAATATIAGLVLDRTGHCGVAASGGARVVLRDLVARGATPADYHAALCLGAGGDVVAERTLIEDYDTAATSARSTLTLSDTTVRRLGPVGTRDVVGIYADCGSSVHLARVELTGTRFGVSATDAAVELEDAVVGDDTSDDPGDALAIYTSTTCTLPPGFVPGISGRRLRLEGNTRLDQGAGNASSTLADLVVHARGPGGTTLGRLGVSSGRFALARALVLDADTGAFEALGDPIVDLEDLTVWGGGVEPFGAVNIGYGVTASLSRVDIRDGSSSGFVIAGRASSPSTAVVRDLRVTTPAVDGVKVDSFVTVTLERVLLDGPGGHGLVLEDRGDLTARDLEIRGAGRLSVSSGIQCKGNWSAGDESRADVERFWIHDDEDVGIEVASRLVRFASGRVSGHATGALILSSMAVPATITGGGTVLYDGNRRSLVIIDE